MEINVILYHIISCLLDLAKMYLAIHYVIGFQKQENRMKSLISLLITSVSILFAAVFIPAQFLSILYLPIIIVVLIVISGIWYLKSLLFSMIAYVCICEIDFFIGSLLNMLPKGKGLYINVKNIGVSTVSLATIFLVAMVCKKLDVTFYKKNIGNRKIFIILEVGILFLNIGIMGIFFAAFSESETGSYGSILLPAVIILCMLLSIIILIFYSAAMNVKEYQLINSTNEMRLQVQKEHYEKLREIDRDTRKFRHDIQNHLLVVLKLMEEDKYDQVKIYLGEVSLRLEDLKPEINCGNGIIDAILNEKLSKCKERNISLKVNGIIHAPIIMTDYDICIIVANALDNAIEACERIEGNRWIEVSLGIHHNFLKIKVINSIYGPVTLRSRKKDKRNHGLGLRNLKDCVARNHGEVKIIVEEDRFVLEVLVQGV